MSDIPERNITLDLNEAPVEPWEVLPLEVPAVKPRIQLPGKGRLVGAFATDLGEHLKNAPLYRKGEECVAQNPGTIQFSTIHPERFVTWIEKYLDCYEGQANEDGSGTTLRTLPTGIARIVMKSDQFCKQLPIVKECNQIRQPILDKDGKLVLLPAGYYAPTQTLTAWGSRQYRLDMTLENARAYLNGLLEEFCFATPNYAKAVQVAAMVTAYGMGLLTDTCIVPAFIYNANDGGAGKGLCVNLALVPVLGSEPASANLESEQEFSKWLFAAARQQERFLFLDNVDIRLQSASLEKYITSSRVCGRVLGSSWNESHAKKTALFITGNGIDMRSDMRRRSLVVDFFLRQVRAETRRIEHPLDVQRIMQETPRILGSLYAFIREWVKAGKPQPSRKHPSFVEWSNTIAGIVEHAGFSCPIPFLDAAPEIDPVTADMERLVERIHATDKPHGITFREVVDTCEQNGLFEGRLPTAGEERRGNTGFGRILKRFQDREFPGQITFQIWGSGHARRYGTKSQPVEAPVLQPLPEPGCTAEQNMPEVVAADEGHEHMPAEVAA